MKYFFSKYIWKVHSAAVQIVVQREVFFFFFFHADGDHSSINFEFRIFSLGRSQLTAEIISNLSLHFVQMFY